MMESDVAVLFHIVIKYGVIESRAAFSKLLRKILARFLILGQSLTISGNGKALTMQT